MPSAASAAQQHILQFSIQWASIALLYYDYILTFPTELRLIWKSDKLKVSTLLYVLYRYALLANVLYLLAISNKLGSNCDTWYKAIGVVSVLGRAAVIFTFLMRTYAVYNKNKIILVVLGAIGLTCVILDCLHVPGVKCHGSSSNQLENTLLSILVCVFEASATILTFLRSMQALRFGGGSVVKKHTLDYLILEQGVLYFGLVSVFTIGATVLNFRASGGFPQRLLNAITLPLSGMLTARFLLRIRAFSRNRDALRGDRSTQQELTSFAANSNPAAAGGARRRRHGNGGYSLTDEFGEDPYSVVSVVFRAADSVTQASNVSAGQTASASSADEEGRRGAVVAEFLGEMRRRLEEEDEADEHGEGLTSTSGTEFDEEKKRRTVGTVTTDVEVGDRHGSGSEIVEILQAEESKEHISRGSALGKED